MTRPRRPRRHRVALVDDHDVVALALRSAIADAPDLEFVGSATTVDDLIGARLSADIVLLDLRLADDSHPADNVARLTDAGCRVLAYTSGESPYLLRQVARTPVLGIIKKSDPVATLPNTIRAAAHGDPIVTTEWAAALDSDPELDRAGLSPQEQRVLSMFASGIRAQSVAEQAGISPGTVDDYVRRVRAKYARIGHPAHTKVDLYKRAVEDGYLPMPGSEP